MISIYPLSMSQNALDNLSEDRILVHFDGSAANNLNHILSNSDDNNEDKAMLTHSSYIDSLKLNGSLASTEDNNVTVLSLNFQSINAKFNYLSPLLVDNTGSSAICLQESSTTSLHFYRTTLALVQYVYRKVQLPLSTSTGQHWL